MTYRGYLICGGSVVWTPPGYHLDQQVQSVFGWDGLATLPGGIHGGRSVAVGTITAGNPGTLALFLQQSRDLQDGACGELVAGGVAWPDVVLVRFLPIGRVLQGMGSWSQHVRAEFLHLT